MTDPWDFDSRHPANEPDYEPEHCIVCDKELEYEQRNFCSEDCDNWYLING